MLMVMLSVDLCLFLLSGDLEHCPLRRLRQTDEDKARLMEEKEEEEEEEEEEEDEEEVTLLLFT